MEQKYYDYFASLSTPDLLHIMSGCQKRYKEGLPCEECHLFKKGRCDGKRYISDKSEEDTFLEDLRLEQQEQM